MTPGIFIVIALAGGFIAGAIAYSRLGTYGSFIGYFLFGALFPLVGIVVACLVRRPVPPPQPPGWYTDPWGQDAYRWWDGTQWTWQLAPPADANL
jgi:Protein of unknown function (DUF2510)